MAAELLAVLVPAAQGDAKAIALRTVASLKEKILDTEPALVVQLNQAHGEKLAIKATKVRGRCFGGVGFGRGCVCVYCTDYCMCLKKRRGYTPF